MSVTLESPILKRGYIIHIKVLPRRDDQDHVYPYKLSDLKCNICDCVHVILYTLSNTRIYIEMKYIFRCKRYINTFHLITEQTFCE